MDQFPSQYSVWVTKHVSGFCALNTTLSRRQQTDSPLCPCCGTTEETVAHLPLCPATHMAERWQESVSGLETSMKEDETYSPIVHCFIETLRTKGATTFASHATPAIMTAAQEQDEIGFQNTIIGMVSTSWRSLQTTYLQAQRSRRTSATWTKNIITHLLDLSHKQWIERNTARYTKKPRMDSQKRRPNN